MKNLGKRVLIDEKGEVNWLLYVHCKVDEKRQSKLINVNEND